MGGFEPDRNPIEQVSAAARWLERRLLVSTTDRHFLVRGVVVFPGWYVERLFSVVRRMAAKLDQARLVLMQR